MELLKIIAKYKTAPLNNYTDHEGGLELWWIVSQTCADNKSMRVQ